MRALWLAGSLALFGLAPAVSAGDPAAKTEGKTYQVPYRLTDTHHIMVRVKINGKGPYNFIIDTGAPALYVAQDLCKKLDIKGDAIHHQRIMFLRLIDDRRADFGIWCKVCEIAHATSG